MMSYSRDFCERSHTRYTLCGNHGVESYCDRTKDWRECEGCVKVRETCMCGTPLAWVEGHLMQENHAHAWTRIRWLP